jgi:hypothetical protein
MSLCGRGVGGIVAAVVLGVAAFVGGLRRGGLAVGSGDSRGRGIAVRA